MTHHEYGSPESATLCELLFQGLRAHIQGLCCDRLTKWCAIYERGHTRFAYILHLKSREEIEIWCRGNQHALSECPGIKYIPRTMLSNGGWTKEFPGRFKIRSIGELKAAVDALLSYSYPESKIL